MQLNFTAVVFDMDGTLFGTERLAIDALQGAFAEHGVDVPPAALEQVIGRGGNETKEYLSRFAPTGVGIEPVLQRGRVRYDALIESAGMPIKPGVTELLDYLRDRRVAIGLATSTRTDVALDNLRRAGLNGYFDTVVGGDQVEYVKPHPGVYLKALRELEAAPGQAIAIEDSDFGIKSAHAAGLRVIYVPDIKRLDAGTKALIHAEYATLRELHHALASAARTTKGSLA
jgi:HAD superfamily hydrolase (TIGR01509 family)